MAILNIIHPRSISCPKNLITPRPTEHHIILEFLSTWRSDKFYLIQLQLHCCVYDYIISCLRIHSIHIEGKLIPSIWNVPDWEMQLYLQNVCKYSYISSSCHRQIFLTISYIFTFKMRLLYFKLIVRLPLLIIDQFQANLSI